MDLMTKGKYKQALQVMDIGGGAVRFIPPLLTNGELDNHLFNKTYGK